ncbi:hypothetical protein QM042_02580 [Escherichia coli]|uniref:hypothetical protein n=1 Tax=Escherichia coli TaxID=562 RepID=UPI0039867C31
MNNKYLNKYITSAIGLVAVFICFYISWMPVFHHGSWSGHDFLFHINRVLSSVNGLKNGQLIPYYDVDYKNHPGHGDDRFYQPSADRSGFIFFYISHDFNVTPAGLSNFMPVPSLLTSYFVLIRINGDKLPSVIYSLCFSCSIYMVDNIFIRSSYPEAMAICAIPLFLYGLGYASNRESVFFLASTEASVRFANIPATLCSGVVFIIYYSINRRRLAQYVVSVCISILLWSLKVFSAVYSTHGESFTMLDRDWFPTMSQRYISLYDLISGEIIKSGPLKGWALANRLPITFAFIWNFATDHNKKKQDYLLVLIILLIICGGINFGFLGGVFTHLSKIQFTSRHIRPAPPGILLILHASGRIKLKYILLIFTSTCLMTSAITVPKLSIRSLTIDIAASANYKDYVLSNAPGLGDWIKELKCDNGLSYAFSRTLGSNGLPVFTCATPPSATRSIPFMSYKPLPSG